MSDSISSEVQPVFASPRRSVALLTLKRDIETVDDAKLAVLEVEGLSNRPPIELLGAGVDVAAHDLALDIAGDPAHVYAVEADKTQLLAMQARLAMFDHVVVLRDGVAQALETNQTALERSSAGHNRTAPGSKVSRAKNSYLSHGFHKYKAKFFPRMARALTNHVCAEGVVGDPYMGSGTLGVEARLMGLSATGIDIDPLSVMIANLKATSLTLDTAEFVGALEEVRMHLDGTLSFAAEWDASDARGIDELPQFIGRKASDEDRASIELDIALIRTAIARLREGEAKRLMLLALSHALATKVSLRWMGTGDPRFSLSVARRSLRSIFYSHTNYLHKRLRERDELWTSGVLRADLGEARTQLGDAKHLPWADGSIDGIVTSPPYLPASSGRETYLRSRAPSLVALGLLTEAELLERESRLVGSIDRSAPADSAGLPESVRDLVEWMLPQRARRPKALPTAAYFLDIAASLREMGRTLKPGGRAAVVLSYQHVFYDSGTREHVRTIVMPDIVQQLVDDPGNEVGMTVSSVSRLQLPKMDFAARPASTGDYSEAVIVLQKR